VVVIITGYVGEDQFLAGTDKGHVVLWEGRNFVQEFKVRLKLGATHHMSEAVELLLRL